ncbi:MAG: XdhC family protein [Sedimenticola sp.]|nr:XdhC family protein [Sedimenticola sp.]MCW8905289.1 XdhC family protein [Sedimenticola sp.]
MERGEPVALATVVATWGSSPRAVGSHMVIRTDQQFAGSVSGGCIEGEVIRTGLSVIDSGEPRLLRFQVANNRAWEMGLSCGGQVEVLVEAVDQDHPVIRQMQERPPAGTVWRLLALDTGQQWLIEADLPTTGEPVPAPLIEPLNNAMQQGHSLRLSDDYFLQTYTTPARLFIVGAVHTAQHLAAMAERCGLAPLVIDPRRGFARADRFPDTALAQQWPDRLFKEQLLGANSALVTLSHDPKIDDPALCAALDSEAFYIGALGSRKTHSERLQRLTEKGYGNRLQRIHGPVGLDLGGRAPAEIAVAILAQLIQARYRREQDAAA